VGGVRGGMRRCVSSALGCQHPARRPSSSRPLHGRGRFPPGAGTPLSTPQSTLRNKAPPGVISQA
jgi:hypothetical protein